MTKKKDDIIRLKEGLANDSLKVAQEALGYMEDQLPECNVRDLVAVFNSAMKTHRDLMSDIIGLSESEAKSEAELAKEYDGKVDQLLKQLKGGD